MSEGGDNSVPFPTEYKGDTVDGDQTKNELDPGAIQRCAILDVIAERDMQDGQWGTILHRLKKVTPNRWLAILMEEVGELAESVLDLDTSDTALSHMRSEAVQCAAVALAIVESIDTGRALALMDGIDVDS